MFARTRIALLAFAGTLAGAGTATAAPPEATPPAAGQLGAVCTRCAANVLFATLPFYQEITGVVGKLATPTAAVGADAVPHVEAAKALGGLMVEVPFKK